MPGQVEPVILPGEAGRLMDSFMDMHVTLTLSPDAMAREVGGETVILHLGSGTYFGLDEVGTRIWQLLAEGLTPAAVCDRLVEEYEVERAVLERDLEALIGELVEHELVSRASG
jgi:hypothetical protein